MAYKPAVEILCSPWA